MNFPERREKPIDIKFYYGNQVEDKIVWRLGEGFSDIYGNQIIQ